MPFRKLEINGHAVVASTCQSLRWLLGTPASRSQARSEIKADPLRREGDHRAHEQFARLSLPSFLANVAGSSRYVNGLK